MDPEAGTCLSGGGGVQGGAPLRERTQYQTIEELLVNGPINTCKCHVTGSKQRKIIIAGQFRVPSPNQHTKNNQSWTVPKPTGPQGCST